MLQRRRARPPNLFSPVATVALLAAFVGCDAAVLELGEIRGDAGIPEAAPTITGDATAPPDAAIAPEASPEASSGDLPLQGPELGLWLRADRNVVTESDGSVSFWRDQSLRHRDLEQPASTLRPEWKASDPTFGGQPAVAFPKRSRVPILNFNTTAPFPAFAAPTTYYLVYRTGANPGTGVGAESFYALFGDAVSVNVYAHSVAVGTSGGTLVAISNLTTEPHLLAATATVFAAPDVFLDALTAAPVKSRGSGNPNANGRLYLGYGVNTINGQGIDGAVAEVIVYEGVAHGPTERKQVLGYLAQRYRLPLAP